MRDKNNAKWLPFVAAVVLSLSLAGCSSSETAPADESTGVQGEAEIALVQERYGDCLASLEVQGDFVFTPKPEIEGAGEVLITSPGLVMVWNTGLSKTGDILTFPADEETITALESVGC
jgi:hypothetical protein